MENKYRNWVFTWNGDNNEFLPDNYKLYKFMEDNFESFVFQTERGQETSRLHLQGCFKTKIRTRKQTLLISFKKEFGLELVINLSLEKMEGDWQQAQDYCTKEDTRVGDRPFLSVDLQKYSGRDLSLFRNREDWFPWQTSIFSQIFNGTTTSFNTPDDRKILWITDIIGCSGKSKFVKYLCYTSRECIKVPFGTATQIRAAVITAAARKVYIIDIPRTLGEDDSLNSIISALEDIKNGFVSSAMYGKYDHIIFEPPHVIVFSNAVCPIALMSEDRWVRYDINQMDKSLKLIK